MRLSKALPITIAAFVLMYLLMGWFIWLITTVFSLGIAPDNPSIRPLQYGNGQQVTPTYQVQPALGQGALDANR